MITLFPSTDQEIFNPVNLIRDWAYHPNITPDGMYVTIGGNFDIDGKVYVYQWDGSSYVSHSIIEPPYLTGSYGPIKYFAKCTAISADGSTIAASIDHDGNTSEWFGAIFVFTWNGSSWDLRDEIQNPDKSVIYYSGFGGRIALDSTGTKLAIGQASYYPVGSPTNSRKGRLYTYGYNSGTSTWDAIADPIDSRSGLSYAYFSHDLSMSRDGLVLAVSEELPQDEIHIYDWVNNNWSYRYTLNVPVVGPGEVFGSITSLWLSTTGDILHVCGSWTDLGNTRASVWSCALGSSTYKWSEVRLWQYWYEALTHLSVSDSGIMAGKRTLSNYQRLTFVSLPVYGSSGNTTLLTAQGVGYAERYTYSGSGSVALPSPFFSAQGIGRLRTPTTFPFEVDYALASGSISETQFSEFSYALSGLQRHIADYGITYRLASSFLSTSGITSTYQLNTYEARTLNLSINYALDLFVSQSKDLNLGYSLSVFDKVISPLKATYGITTSVSTRSYLGFACELTSHHLNNQYLGSTYSLNTHRNIREFLELQWGLDAAVLSGSRLSLTYALPAYETKYVSYQNIEFKLPAYIDQRTTFNNSYELIAYLTELGFADLSYTIAAVDQATVYAVSLDTTAVSSYSNYGFNSIYNNLAANETGIFKLEGALDQDISIPVSLTSGKVDFNSNFLKRLTDAYIGMDSDESFTLTVTTETGSIVYDINSSAGLHTVKRNLARGSKGRYWQLEIFKNMGSTFRLHTLDVLPEILKRRR